MRVPNNIFCALACKAVSKLHPDLAQKYGQIQLPGWPFQYISIGMVSNVKDLGCQAFQVAENHPIIRNAKFHRGSSLRMSSFGGFMALVASQATYDFDRAS